MTLTIALAFVVVIPGPNVVAVTTAALRSRSGGFRTAMGVSTGDMIWAVSAMVGLGPMLASVRPLFLALRLAGVVYLLVVAARLLRSRGEEAAENEAGPMAGRAFARGLFVDLSNPKAAVFFATLFASLLPQMLTVDLAVLVLVAVPAVVYGWYLLLAAVASRPSFHAWYRRKQTAINRGAALALGLLAGRLALSIADPADVA